MPSQIILASGSAIRQELLRNANIDFTVERPKIDEETLTASLLAEQAKPRDIADALAEFKALKIATKHRGGLVIGCDQILHHVDRLLNKPLTQAEAFEQLQGIRGSTHSLYSAAVIFEDGQPIWRVVNEARMRMRDVSDTYLKDYVARNWLDIQHCVGCYQLEGEGVRLFSQISGDYFTVLGFPLLDVLNFLSLKGAIPG